MRCACGCGQIVTPGKTYRKGHWLRAHPFPSRAQLTPEHREKIRASSIAYGPRPRTPEHQAKIAAAKRGKPLPPLTPEHREKIAASKRGKKRGSMPEYWREKIRASSKAFGSRPRSAEHQAIMTAAMKLVATRPAWRAFQREHLSKVRPGRRPSSLERLVAHVLTDAGIPHIAQAPLGWYHVDFLLPHIRVVLECDGAYWHSSPKQQRDDVRRDAWLTRHGYTVLRLTEAAIRADAQQSVFQSLQPFI
jgi:very-short-patch-repair endonuclease